MTRVPLVSPLVSPLPTPRTAMIARAWRTPLGKTIDEVMARLYAGERAAVTDSRAGYACSTVATLRDAPAPSRQSRFLGRMGLVALEVATEAMAAGRVEAGPRTGVFCGVGGLRAHWEDMMVAFADQGDDGERMWERGLRDVHPYWMLRHLSNNVHAIASATLGLRGEGATFGGATAGAQAIAAANRALCSGAIDAALVIAYDSLLEPETLVELGARGSATRAAVGDLSAPYSTNAAGFVPGEAAAAIVLVRETDRSFVTLAARASAGPERATAEPRAFEPGAAETLARCIADLVGSCGDLRDRPCDEAGCQATHADDAGRRAGVDDAGRSALDCVAIVDGAALAEPHDDRDERIALASQVGAQCPLGAITAATGQLGAATAVVQAIALAEMLRAGSLAPVAGLHDSLVSDGPLVPLVRATPTEGRRAVGLQVGVPGLAAAILVEVSR